MTIAKEKLEQQQSPQETQEQRFRRLEAQWMEDTRFLSSSTQIKSHPAFLEIIGMGDAVVPFMLRDLEEKPRLWVWALPKITGDNPVPRRTKGTLPKWRRHGCNGAKPRDSSGESPLGRVSQADSESLSSHESGIRELQLYCLGRRRHTSLVVAGTVRGHLLADKNP
jgi:hypothetical protein